MKVKNLKYIAFASLVSITSHASARNAWDGTGHMLVAQVAYDRLNDKARARVDELAAKLHRGDMTYNGINIACWPDDIKGPANDPEFRGFYKPWHYIDIGCNSNDPDQFAHPPVLTKTNGNVFVALTHCVDLIRNNRPMRWYRTSRWRLRLSCISSATSTSRCIQPRVTIRIRNRMTDSRMMLAAMV